MIYAHLICLRAYEWKSSDRHEQTDLHSPRIRMFLMTSVARFSIFPVLNRSRQTFRPIYE